MSILTKATLATITEAMANMAKEDNSTKTLFTEAYNLFKGFRKDKANLKICKAEFNTAIEAACSVDSFVSRAKKAAKLAEQYINMAVFSKFDKLHYYNIEALVKLFAFAKKNLTVDAQKEIKDAVANTWVAGMGLADYNNAIKATVQELKVQYKIQDVEGDFKFQDYYQGIVSKLDKLNIEELKMLMDTVSDKFESLEREELEKTVEAVA